MYADIGEDMEEIEERLNRYLEITEKALHKAKIAIPQTGSLYKQAEDFLDMANRYYEDAKYFKAQNKPVTALAAVTYAHAWLDIGARLGLFDVDKDYILFTLSK